ncbi:MAG: ABC transporter permease [Spirochaetes bacterium RBG_16_67_19]|nr:MAG: ABC transporter permease [Spirochaetes bacterium RBG_16_67_19]
MGAPAPARRIASTASGAQRRRDTLVGILLVLPAILLALGFKIVPLIRGIYASFFVSQFGETGHWAGLANYLRMLGDPKVLEAFLNAGKVVLTLPAWVILPLFVALLIFQRTPGWRLFRAVYFLPYTIAPVIVGQVFRELLHAQGPLNELLRKIGLGFLALSWLGDKRVALFSLVGVVLWSYFGLGVVTYLAGLGTIPDELFDAAALDGAGFLTRMFRIVIPIILPVMGYWTILCTSGLLVWMFPFIFAMTEGGPGYATMLPEYLVYITAFRFSELGYGTTIGVALFVFVLIFATFQVRYMYVSGTRRQKA